MVEYADVEVEGFKLQLPKQLRRSKSMPLFRGRLNSGGVKYELIVVVGTAATDEIQEAQRASSWKMPRVREWDGVTWHYHHFGPSVTRPGGAEIGSTHVLADTLNEVHRSTIAFPIGSKWASLDIQSSRGVLRWDEFKSVAATIIRSVRT